MATALLPLHIIFVYMEPLLRRLCKVAFLLQQVAHSIRCEAPL